MKVDAPLMEQDLAGTGAAAKAYEERGFDGVFSVEGPHDPFLPLALAARETERVELATSIAIAFARNPMTCAYMANDLQLISHGRFTLGLGTQIRPHIEKRFSQTWSKPDARMREFVQAIRAVWACWNDGGRLDFRGEFYTHRLMTPVFNPGPNPHGAPPIALAGFGPSMVRVAGEVADGWIVHPLHTRKFLHDVSIPALEEGASRGGRGASDVAIGCQVITMIGSNDEQLERARNNGRAQMAFYASTPAYRVLLDHHGWGEIQPELNRLSKEGKWLDMMSHVSDDMLDTVGVSGTPAAVASELVARYDFADRVSLVIYNETEPGAVDDILRTVKAA